MQLRDMLFVILLGMCIFSLIIVFQIRAGIVDLILNRYHTLAYQLAYVPSIRIRGSKKGTPQQQKLT